ncbi:MAG TPA: DUF3090 domain-containing protein [Actinomycetota bacterium]|nr:DUF3090 domain-containing protein [Actinomycetota bacterium]
MLIELDPVDRLTTDAIGPPGSRTFYIQARKDDRLVTLLVEKQQVQLLSASVVEILSRIGKETGQGPAEEAMQLEEPIEPEWRAGRLSIGYNEERDLVVLEVEEAVDEGDEAEEESPQGGGAVEPEIDPALIEDLERAAGDVEGYAGTEGRRVRFWATREQMLSLARHGAAVCARGRPRCQLCGNPLDPEGHICPALNGHRGTDSE